MLVAAAAETALKAAHLVLAVRAAAAQAPLQRAYLERLTLAVAAAAAAHHMVVAEQAVLALSLSATLTLIPPQRQQRVHLR